MQTPVRLPAKVNGRSRAVTVRYAKGGEEVRKPKGKEGAGGERHRRAATVTERAKRVSEKIGRRDSERLRHREQVRAAGRTGNEWRRAKGNGSVAADQMEKGAARREGSRREY